MQHEEKDRRHRVELENARSQPAGLAPPSRAADTEGELEVLRGKLEDVAVELAISRSQNDDLRRSAQGSGDGWKDKYTKLVDRLREGNVRVSPSASGETERIEELKTELNELKMKYEHGQKEIEGMETTIQQWDEWYEEEYPQTAGGGETDTPATRRAGVPTAEAVTDSPARFVDPLGQPAGGGGGRAILLRSCSCAARLAYQVQGVG